MQVTIFIFLIDDLAKVKHSQALTMLAGLCWLISILKFPYLNEFNLKTFIYTRVWPVGWIQRLSDPFPA